MKRVAPGILRRTSRPRAAMLSALACIVVAALAGSASGGDRHHVAKPPIKIGVIISLTGPYQIFGVQSKQSVNLAINDINARGGINGRRVTFKYFDDQSTPEGASLAAQQAAADSSVVAVTGGNTGVTGSVESQIFEKAGIPFVGTFGETTNDFPGKWVFKQSPSFPQHAQAILSFMKKVLKVQSLGIVYQDIGYGQAVSGTMKTKAKDFGLRITAAEAVPPGTTDATPQLRNVISSGAQAISMVSSNGHSVIVANWASLGKPVPLVGDLGSSTPANLAAAGDLARGVPTLTYYNATDPSPRQERFTKIFQKAYGDVPQVINASSWDGIQILFQVMKGIKNPTRSSVRTGLEKLRKFNGVGGIYSFSKTNHQGFTLAGFQWNTYLGNGKYIVNKAWAKTVKR